EQRPPLSWAIRRTERMATLISGNSQTVIDAAIGRGIPRERLRLVPNGHPPMPAMPPPNGETALLGCVAAFRPEKGHLKLLDVLGRVKTSTPWRIDLAGEGPLRAEVERRAK